jgi:hypothetical protein
MGDVLGCVGEQQEGNIQALGLQWEAQASKAISAATAYPLGQSKQKFSERLVQYILNHDEQAVPSHAGQENELSGYSLLSFRIEPRI